MRVAELALKINATVVGNADLEVAGLATLEEAGPSQLSFLANPRYAAAFQKTRAGAVCVGQDVRCDHTTLLVSSDPYFTFCRAMVELVGYRKHPFAGVHPMAWVDPTATIGPGTVVYPFTFVGPRCSIGRDCVLYPNVSLYDDCVLGDRVVLHSGCVIGNDGYGFATHGGVHNKIPQIGNVIIEDDVEIGAGACIARGALGPTVVARGTKFADHVCIGHGVRIGRHNLIVSQVGIAGSTTTGDYVTMGGQVGVAGHLKIGSFVKIGAQSGVMNDIPEKTDVLGSPATEIRQAKRTYVAMFQVPELIKRVRELERQLEDLRDDLRPDESGVV